MKINKLTQISEGLTRIPKTTLETVNQTKLPENIISLLEQAPTKDVADFANTLTDHSSMLETGSIASDSISQVAEHAGHNIFGGAMVFRLINPIRDFAKGNISAGLKRTSVNIVDYAIYKARLVYGGLGAIRGLIVKMRGGGDAPDAGFVNGFFYAMKHWGKGRKSVEEALINPKQFWQALKNNPLDAQYAIYNEERQNWLNKHKQSILQKSEINRKSIEDWGQARLQMLNSSQEMLRHMIAREQVIQQANQKQIINVEISNNELIGKLESLKVLQQSLLNDFNKCIKEMKETMQSIPSDSKEFETMQNIANLSNNYYAEEFNNINDVERFRKCDLMVTRDNALPLKEGQYYLCDVPGAVVINEDTEEEIGKVTDVMETGANNVFVIETKEGKEVLFPVIPDCIKKVDTKEGIVRAHVMKGLIE